MKSVFIVLLILFLAIYGSSKTYQMKEGIRFLLFTRKNLRAQVLVVGDRQLLIDSNYDRSHQTIFLIHEYMINIEWSSEWKEMINELLKRDNFNIIVVDWLKFSLVSYDKAVQNSKTVGTEVANMIKFLKNSVGANPVDFHIIGHGLGAHIGGFAGKNIKIGRITGLDPSGLHFQNVPSDNRLDKSDAYFVDIIHTDIENARSIGLGTAEIIGHADFFPNNGNNQPNCKYYPTKSITRDFLNNYACDHVQAMHFFINSINRCSYVGIKCPDWSFFLTEKCIDCGPSGANCALMGFNLNPRQIDFIARRNVFFLKTSIYPPFCGKYIVYT